MMPQRSTRNARNENCEVVHSNARLIDETHLDVSKVLVLSNVKIKNQANGMEMKYRLVAESEADLKTGRISVTSPLEAAHENAQRPTTLLSR
jgi:transcription elongation GreA/GreB family factor